MDASIIVSVVKLREFYKYGWSKNIDDPLHLNYNTFTYRDGRNTATAQDLEVVSQQVSINSLITGTDSSQRQSGSGEFTKTAAK